MISDKVSLLGPYVKAKETFRCPGDKKLRAVGGKRILWPRSYGMNAYVAWNAAPWNNMPDDRKYVVVRKTADAASPDQTFLFGEIHPDSICRPMFGINMDSQAIYHVPGNYHGRQSNFSFLDGHAETKRWQDPLFNNPKPTPANWHDHGGNMVRPAGRNDLDWLKSRATVRR